MTFSSIPFLFYFLPLFLAFYFAAPWKNAALLAASLIFYAWGEPVFILVLVASLVLNHVIGKKISESRDRRILAIGIAGNLLVLGWFKYAGFLADGVNRVAAITGLDAALNLSPHLPLGISFFTFQAISLLVDLYRRDAEAPKNFRDTALYISMFPQLIAGPIVRYKEVAEQLRARDHTLEKFSGGARVFILGLAQKVLLANTFAVTADAAFAANGASSLSAGAAWIGLAAYTLQIYFDFAGYSNMAIGMGRMFGFELPRNFDFPYASQSLTEFWRRWHITLSQWFRDYLYIPLGGNRGAPARTYLNLWIVFLLCGLWHGANIVFVLWGAYHGAILVAERAGLGKILAAAPRALRHIYLPLVVAFGWVLFRAESVVLAGKYYAALFGVGDDTLNTGVDAIAVSGFPWALSFGAIVALRPLVAEAGAALGRLVTVRLPEPVGVPAAFVSMQAALAVLFILCAAALAGGAYNPFIYFRF